MEKIILKEFRHHDSPQIAINFGYDQVMIDHLKKLKGISWSNTFGCFYLASGYKNLNRLFRHLNGRGHFVDYSALNIPEMRKRETNTEILTIEPEDPKVLAFRKYLHGQRYSKSTMKTYTSFVRKFLKFHDFKNEFNLTDVDRFVETEIAAKDYSISTHRQCISALKQYFDLSGQENFDSTKLKRPGKSRYLPSVLSKEEVLDLLRATRNLKHRAILALIYSSGLRIGELLDLKLKNIDVDRRQILIKQAKGRKDRYVMLAESFLPLLFNYLQTYEPKVYFTEGLNAGQYTASSVRSFLRKSSKLAKIRKPVTPHTLRHSYATHMLENGIDIRYIQELLGHSRPETTMIYTHVTQKDLSKIRSPLDESIKELLERNKANPNLRLSRNFLD